MTNLSDTQIRRLARTAERAGDNTTVALCIVALASGLTDAPSADPRVERARYELEALGVIPEHIGSDVAARAALRAGDLA